MKLLIWILIAYGITNILVIGSIFLMLRVNVKKRAEGTTNSTGTSGTSGNITPETGSQFYKFVDGVLSCMMCCSMWVGFFLGMFIWSPSANYLETSSLISWFFDGALSSAGVCLIGIFINHYKMRDENQ